MDSDELRAGAAGKIVAADAAAKEGVAGEKDGVLRFRRGRQRRVNGRIKRDAAGRVAGDVDDFEPDCSDGDYVAVVQENVRRR